MISAKPRQCFWFLQEPDDILMDIADLKERMTKGLNKRLQSKDAIKNGMAERYYQFREMYHAKIFRRKNNNIKPRIFDSEGVLN